MNRFVVLTDTVCQGWVNCWSEDDKPQTFATREEAQAELDEYIQDTLDMQRDQLALGDRDADECDDEDSLRDQHRIEEDFPDSHINGLRAIYTGENA
jgi:hypothetical protein